MPLVYFSCPDGVTRKITDCLDKCPNPKGRCLSLPTLYEIGKARPWKGNPSTTQLLKGVRQAYLEIKYPFAISPMESAFMLLGTRIHTRLDFTAKQLGMMSEQKLDSEITGILDLLEPDALEPDKYILYDYKTSGSFAVARALGRKSDDSEPDMDEWEKQLNKYRIEIEKLGFPISRMIIQACVRDGGTFSARNNNVSEKFVLIPVKKLDDLDIYYYFHDKRTVLLKALETDTVPTMCSYNESWGQRRCKGGYCPVVAYCKEGAQIARIPYMGDGE